MGKKLLFVIAVGLLFTVCGCTKEDTGAAGKTPGTEYTQNEAGQLSTGNAEQKESGVTVYPLPDDTMEELNDATLSVSLEEGGAYVDDTGKMQMDVKIYAYDRYDMVDISELKVGDTIVTYAGETKVASLERGAGGTLYINGGMEKGGFDLASDESGIFYEIGYNDAKNWYEVGEATIRVSADFMGYDNADPERGEVLIYPGDFLVGEVKNYNFTPHNTTIRVENGQIVEMHRVYTP